MTARPDVRPQRGVEFSGVRRCSGGTMRIFVFGSVAGVAISLTAAALIAYLWPWQIQATGTATGVETWVKRQLLDRALLRQATSGSSPVEVSKENLLAGMKIFRDGCAGCHGDAHEPSTWGKTSFLPRAPQFATEPTHRPEWQIHWIVKNGIRNTAMGAWERLLPDEQIWRVSMFVSHMNALPPTVNAEWRNRH